MKWFHEWRLARVRAAIASLQAETSVRLADDYTAHSRLRVLTRLAEGLERRLGRAPRAVVPARPATAAAAATATATAAAAAAAAVKVVEPVEPVEEAA